MVIQMNPIDQIKNCIKDKKSFVLQGGAGSGKTETLKSVMEFLVNDYSGSQVACITHTNLAVDEIKSRVGEGNHTISTIHSFLNGFISNYKLNIHQVIHELFVVPMMARSEGSGDATHKKEEHDKYKKVHKRYSSALYSVKKEKADKAIGKKEYDKEPEKYNLDLNDKIEELNSKILEIISNKDPLSVQYNETRFDSFEELSFGHDGLLIISYLLFKTFPRLGKILQDKYQYVLIDEYQDTHPLVVAIFLSFLPRENLTTIGFFGDSMQAIYEEGIGSLSEYVSNGKLLKIDKLDNFRCSYPVVDVINKLRTDGLTQEVAFKMKDGVLEVAADRTGEAQIFYSISDSKPNAFASPQDKSAYFEKLEKLIEEAKKRNPGATVLMLTNKSISSKAGFKALYEVFSDRYSDPREEIDYYLERMQVEELCSLTKAFISKDFNIILVALKKLGFAISRAADKKVIFSNFEKLSEGKMSLHESIEFAFKSKMLKPSEQYAFLTARRTELLDSLANDESFKKFKADYLSGKNTFARMKEVVPDLEEDSFIELERSLTRETFYTDLFSKKILFSEAISYYDYLNEGAGLITMHKTKGASIDNVIVVLEEFFWNEYKFSSIFTDNSDERIKNKNLKLVYVACSRARTNLACVRLISPDEEPGLSKFFDHMVKIDLEAQKP